MTLLPRAGFEPKKHNIDQHATITRIPPGRLRPRAQSFNADLMSPFHLSNTSALQGSLERSIERRHVPPTEHVIVRTVNLMESYFTVGIILPLV